jgi:hypothetical protein
VNGYQSCQTVPSKYQKAMLRTLAARKTSMFDMFVVGTPDGIVDIKTMKPKTYNASMVHDALYQYFKWYDFCEGLAAEAKVVDRFFKDHNFDLVSIVCKAGRIPKEEIGIRARRSFIKASDSGKIQVIDQSRKY